MEAKGRPREPKERPKGGQREAKGRPRGGQERPKEARDENRPKPGQGNQFFGTIFGSILEAPGLKKSVKIKKAISQKQSSRSRVVRILREKA